MRPYCHAATRAAGHLLPCLAGAVVSIVARTRPAVRPLPSTPRSTMLRRRVADGWESTSPYRRRTLAAMVQVLLIDDAEDTCALYAHYFSDAVGLEVGKAHTAAAGIEMARTLQPSVIVLDFALPDLDGLKLARRLRKDPRTASIPLFLLTGYRAYVESGVELFVKVLTKPCTPDELLKAITPAFRRAATAPR